MTTMKRFCLFLIGAEISQLAIDHTHGFLGWAVMTTLLLIPVVGVVVIYEIKEAA